MVQMPQTNATTTAKPANQFDCRMPALKSRSNSSCPKSAACSRSKSYRMCLMPVGLISAITKPLLGSVSRAHQARKLCSQGIESLKCSLFKTNLSTKSATCSLRVRSR